MYSGDCSSCNITNEFGAGTATRALPNKLGANIAVKHIVKIILLFRVESFRNFKAIPTTMLIANAMIKPMRYVCNITN